MQSFNKLNIKKILRYMDFLKNNSPRHRFRFSQQAWLPQDKTADPVLRRLHERLVLSSCKVTNMERCPVRMRVCHNLQYRVLMHAIPYGAKLLNADWQRQRALFLNHEGTFGDQGGMVT